MSAMRDTVEVLSQDSLYADEAKRAKDRLRAIVGDAYEKEVALGAPNDARACVERPAVFKGGDIGE